MKIKTNHEVTFTFSPKDYFLVHSENQDTTDEWSLNWRIDRSYKGKDDDVGFPVIFLSDEEAEELKKYFSVIEIPKEIE